MAAHVHKFFLIALVFFPIMSSYSDEKVDEFRIYNKKFYVLISETITYKENINIEEKIRDLILNNEYDSFIYRKQFGNSNLYYTSGYYLNSYEEYAHIKFIIKELDENIHYGIELSDDFFTNLEMTEEEIEYFKNNNYYKNQYEGVGRDEYGEYRIVKQIHFNSNVEIFETFRFLYYQLKFYMAYTMKTIENNNGE